MGADLTPDERKKIYLEEKARAKAKDKLASEKKKKEQTQGCLGCLGLIVLIFLGTRFCPGEPEDPVEKAKRLEESRARMAAIQCTHFVRDRLVSPSTADFPFSKRSIPVGEDTYLSRSYVDSQNRFGATVRTEYVCKIRFDGGSDLGIENWTLIELKMNPR